MFALDREHLLRTCTHAGSDHKHPFSKGQEDIFSIVLPNLGQIRRLLLQRSDVGSTARDALSPFGRKWKPCRVVVRDERGETSIFENDQGWLKQGTLELGLRTEPPTYTAVGVLSPSSSADCLEDLCATVELHPASVPLDDRSRCGDLVPHATMVAVEQAQPINQQLNFECELMGLD